MSSKSNVVSSSKQGDSAHGQSFLSQASTAARSGNYMLASDLIARARACGGSTGVAGLLLQARVFAQQGMFLRAEACWTEALQIDPANKECVEGLAEIRKANTRLSRVRSILLAFLLVIAGASVWWNGHIERLHLQQQQLDISNRLIAVESRIGKLTAAQTEAQASDIASLRTLSNRVEEMRRAESAENYKTALRVQQEAQATRAVLDRVIADTKEIRDRLAGQDAKGTEKAAGDLLNSRGRP